MVWENKKLFDRAISPSGAVYISAFENELIRQGIVFGFSKRLTIPGGGDVKILFDPTPYAGDYILLLPPFIKTFGAGPIFIDVYKEPEFSVGTVIESINFNFNSSNTADMVIKQDPTISDMGTKAPNEYATYSALEGGGAHTTQVGGEAAAGDLIFDLDITKPFMYVLSNQDATNAALATFVTDWAEI